MLSKFKRASKSPAGFSKVEHAKQVTPTPPPIPIQPKQQPQIPADDSAQDHEDPLNFGSTYESASDMPLVYSEEAIENSLRRQEQMKHDHDVEQEKTDRILDEIEKQMKHFAEQKDSEELPAEQVQEGIPQPVELTTILSPSPVVESIMTLPPGRIYAISRRSLENPFTTHANKLHAQILYTTSTLLEAKSVLSQRLILSQNSTIGKLDAWESVLIKTLMELKPPKFRRKELQKNLAIKLKEITQDLNWICQVLMKITINSRIGVNMINKVYRRVLDRAKVRKQGLHSSKSADATKDKKIFALDQLIKMSGKPAEKVQVEPGTTKRILELTEEGLKLYNVKEPKLVDYEEFTYLERKAMLSAFIVETQIVIQRVSNLVSKLGASEPDFRSTQLKFRAKLKFNPNLVPENLMEREILALNKLSLCKDHVVDLERVKEIKDEMERFSSICEHVSSLFKASACGFIALEKKQGSVIRGKPLERLRKFKLDEQLLLPFALSESGSGMVQQQQVTKFLNGIDEAAAGHTVEWAADTASVNMLPTVKSTKSIKMLKNVPSRMSRKERIISPQSSTETLSEGGSKKIQSKYWSFWKSKQNTAA